MSEGTSPSTPSSNNLPRGLVSKSGLPFNPNQRLPSLRSSLSKPSLLFQSSVSFTTNSLINASSNVKRSCEPSGVDSVVTRRQSESRSFSSGTKQGKNSDWRGSPAGRGRRQNPKKVKKLIQLEPAVFTGASRPSFKSALSESNLEKKPRGKRSQVPTTTTVIQEPEEAIEPAFIEGKLYQDNFISRSSDSEETEFLPQGWESLSLPAVKEPTPTTDENWLSPSLADKLVMFQLPKMLENQTDIKLGKLRIYESGRVELVNNPSDLTFEVMRSEPSEGKIQQSREQGNRMDLSIPGESLKNLDEENLEDPKSQAIEPTFNREVVVYSGRNLICLGKLEPNSAIVIPKILNTS